MGCRILQRDVIGKRRKKTIESGWRAAEITDAICLGSNHPSIRFMIQKETMIDSWQLRYVSNHNDDKIKRLTEEVKQLKLRSTITKRTSEPTVQRQVHNWVKQRLREQGITNLEFDKEYERLEPTSRGQIKV